MSSLKRQSSWQEDIAKNFSRLFSRTKSEDDGKLVGKTAEIINSSENKENEIISPSETKEEPLSEELQADLSQGFQGTDIKNTSPKDEVRFQSEDPASLPLPASAAAAAPPVTKQAGDAPPLDVFFKKLSSLFNLSSKSDSEDPKSSAQQGAGVTQDADQNLKGMPSEGQQNGTLRDPSEKLGAAESQSQPKSERQRVEKAQDHLGTDKEAASQQSPVQLPPGLHEPNKQNGWTSDSLQLDQSYSNGNHLVSGEAAVEEPTSSTAAQSHDLSCPSAVTYATYRGLRKMKKLMRKQLPQVASPIPEVLEDGIIQSMNSEHTGISGTAGEASSFQLTGQTNVESAESLHGRNPGTASPHARLGSEPEDYSNTDSQPEGPIRSLKQNGAYIDTDPHNQPRPGLHESKQNTLPVNEQLAKQHTSADMDMISDSSSALASLAAAAKEGNDMHLSSEGVLSPAANETQRDVAGNSDKETAKPMSGIFNEATDGQTEQAEILSHQKDIARSLTEANAVLHSQAERPQGTEHTYQPAAHSMSIASPGYQNNPVFRYNISLPEAQETDIKEILIPGARSVETVGQEHSALKENESKPIPARKQETAEADINIHALQSESRQMVQNILRNASAALQKLDASESENADLLNVNSEDLSSVLKSAEPRGQSIETPTGKVNESSLRLDLNSAASPTQTNTPSTSSTPTEMKQTVAYSHYESLLDSDIHTKPNISVCVESALYRYHQSSIESNDSERQADNLTQNSKPMTSISERVNTGITLGQDTVTEEQPVNVSFKDNEDKLHATETEMNRDFNATISRKATEIVNEVFQLAKVTVSSEQHSHCLPKVTQEETVDIPQRFPIEEIHSVVTTNVKEHPGQVTDVAQEVSGPFTTEAQTRELNGVTKLKTSLSTETALIPKANLVAELILSAPQELSQKSDTANDICDGTKTTNDITENKITLTSDQCDGTSTETPSKCLKDAWQAEEAGDRSTKPQDFHEVPHRDGEEGQPFLLVKSYLVSVLEGESDLGYSDSVLSTHPGCAEQELVSSSELPVINLHVYDEQESHKNEVDGSFAAISEEDEAEASGYEQGMLLSQNFRRKQLYPFSLSPIFEEESSREDTNMEDLPENEEEVMKSAEDQALSILSLLQSVSERLKLSSLSNRDEDCFEEPSRAEVDSPSEDSSMRRDDNAIQTTEEDQIAQMKKTLLEETCNDGTALTETSGPLVRVKENNSTEPLVSENKGVCQTTQDTSRSSDIPFKASAASVSPIYQYLQAIPSIPKHQEVPQSTIKQHLAEEDFPNSVASDPKPGGTPTGLIDTRNLKINPRPGKMIIYDAINFSGKKHEILSNIQDATSMMFPQGVSIKVVRGCWVLYAEPRYRGQYLVLQEGETVLSHFGGSPTTVAIGSIKRVVENHSIPEIQLRHLQGNIQGTSVSFQNEIKDLEALGAAPDLSSVTVKSGCWLAYDDTNFSGNSVLLQANDSASQDAGKPEITHVKSLRPLEMGGLKVQKPLDPKIVLYEFACFTGQSKEVTDNVHNVSALKGLIGVGSLRVIGGVWVAYTAEGYNGKQYLLEEGEYLDWQAWGGLNNTVLSLRYVQADFVEPSVTLFEEGQLKNTNKPDIADLDIPDLESVGFEKGIDSIHVSNGVWVAYRQKHFCGEQYILEKGVYKSMSDWGGSDSTILSIRPIRLETMGSTEPQYLLRLYSEPHYRGRCAEYTTEALDCSVFEPKSFRVIHGSWLLFDEEGFAGNQFVLEEGLYPDLTSCGCMATSIKSMKPIQYDFSEPSISLFSLDSFEGKELVVEESDISLLNKNFFSQSVRVTSGLWVVYEYASFKGRQMLLTGGEFRCWSDYSGWNTIGSLQPLPQPKVYIRLRNRALGTFLTAEDNGEKSKPSRVSVCPSNGKSTQIWTFSQGLLKSKVNKTCMALIGGKSTAGANVALWPEHGRIHQRWRFNKDSTITSYLNASLVLDVKGGKGYDRDHLIMNPHTAGQITQLWDIEML
ncbi:uncharacterized protein LOC117972662 [Acipenser ruthenus]|uniref:uncharacterized protein LOC117972662 n=1 Tax=Acipenser ruthenus TaxID=7906 RepID=UPI002741259A|nr:uncharacterized protein LOC117972662 [Acipenser ruthenus]